jgi:hypothetical protein
MIRFLFCRKYIFVIFIINFFNNSVLSEQSSCLNYPYPEGIFINRKSINKKQLIYTKSVAIKSQNIRKIEFAKKKNKILASSSLYEHIKRHYPNIEDEEIGMYNLYSCFDSDGTYKISYAQRDVSLKKLNIFQKVRNFIESNFINK